MKRILSGSSQTGNDVRTVLFRSSGFQHRGSSDSVVLVLVPVVPVVPVVPGSEPGPGSSSVCRIWAGSSDTKIKSQFLSGTAARPVSGPGLGRFSLRGGGSDWNRVCGTQRDQNRGRMSRLGGSQQRKLKVSFLIFKWVSIQRPTFHLDPDLVLVLHKWISGLGQTGPSV